MHGLLWLGVIFIQLMHVEYFNKDTHKMNVLSETLLAKLYSYFVFKKL